MLQVSAISLLFGLTSFVTLAAAFYIYIDAYRSRRYGAFLVITGVVLGTIELAVAALCAVATLQLW